MVYVYRVSRLKTPALTFSCCGDTQDDTSVYAKLHFPDENETTAHLPFHAHFRAPESPPPPSVARSSSSLPWGRPTTTSALQVLRASTLSPELGPSGPIASVKGVEASHFACKDD